MNDSQAGVRRVRRLLIAAAILLPILLIAALAWIIWFGPQRKIDAEIARIRAAGEPVTLEELDAFYPYPPADQDATDLWLDVISPLDRSAFRAASAQVPFFVQNQNASLPGDPWPDITVAEVFLEQQAETLQLLHEAAERGASVRYPLDFQAGINIDLSHAQRIRAATRLLRLEARVRAYRGDGAGAAQSLHAMVAAGRTLEPEPNMVSQLVSMAARNMAVDEVRVLLPLGVFSEKDLHRFQTLLRDEGFQEALFRAMLGERVLGIHSFEHPEVLLSTPGAASGNWGWVRTWFRGDFVFYLDSMRRIIAATKRPWREALDEIERVDEEVRALLGFRHLLTSMLMPALDAAFRASARATALSRSADAAIAVELFRRRHDRFPERLAVLVPDFLPRVPADPFSSEPLKYKIEEDGYVVYSVGPDQVDDGGDATPQPGARRGPDYVYRVTFPKEK